jgi:hypothetical protein
MRATEEAIRQMRLPMTRFYTDPDGDPFLAHHVLADGCAGFSRLLSAAKQNDVPFDGIGIQAHEPRTMRFPMDRVRD